MSCPALSFPRYSIPCIGNSLGFLAKLCVIDGKNREITKKLVQPVPPHPCWTHGNFNGKMTKKIKWPKITFLGQCCQAVQIICICPDDCAFSVLDNRHCADICTICQKCPFEVWKGFSQRLRTYICNQVDSAILKLSFVQASMEQIYCSTKQTYMVITLFCRGMGNVPFTRVLLWIAFCRQYALLGFVLCRLLRRHLGLDSDFAQISGPKFGSWQLCSGVQNDSQSV